MAALVWRVRRAEAPITFDAEIPMLQRLELN
jgi:hypothetical protein